MTWKRLVVSRMPNKNSNMSTVIIIFFFGICNSTYWFIKVGKQNSSLSGIANCYLGRVAVERESSNKKTHFWGHLNVLTLLSSVSIYSIQQWNASSAGKHVHRSMYIESELRNYLLECFSPESFSLCEMYKRIIYQSMHHFHCWLDINQVWMILKYKHTSQNDFISPDATKSSAF